MNKQTFMGVCFGLLCFVGVADAVTYMNSRSLVVNDTAFVYQEGNVGIGTSQPSAALHFERSNHPFDLVFLRGHTASGPVGYGFYTGKMSNPANGVIAIRGLNGTSSANILVFASQNVAIGPVFEPASSSDVVRGRFHIQGDAFVGTPNTPVTKMTGVVQKPNGVSAEYYTKGDFPGPGGQRAKISFGIERGSSDFFKILVDGQVVRFGRNNGSSKTFVIQHPRIADRYLVHAMQELPENTVQYVGTAQLVSGRAEVVLPSYFETLTAQEGRYIRVSGVDGFSRLRILSDDGKLIHNGRFVVVSDDKKDQVFDWEVTAVRKDVPPLLVTPRRDQVRIKGVAPYTYLEGLEGAR